MFSISTLVDVVRIPPTLFETTLKKAAMNILKEKYESMINAELGYIIMILDAKVDDMGKMIAGDGGTFHKVKFEALYILSKAAGDRPGGDSRHYRLWRICPNRPNRCPAAPFTGDG